MILIHIFSISTSLIVFFIWDIYSICSILAILFMLFIAALLVILPLIRHFRGKRNLSPQTSHIDLIPKYISIYLGAFLLFSFSIKTIHYFFDLIYLLYLDIRKAQNLEDAISIIVGVIVLPVFLGGFIKYITLFLQRKELIYYNKNKISYVLFALIRFFLIICSGFLLSKAFNTDIGTSPQNNATNHALITVSVSNNIFSFNNGFSADYLNASFSIKDTNFTDINKKQACDIRSNPFCARWTYTSFVILFASYELFAQYFEKQSNKQQLHMRKKDIKRRHRNMRRVRKKITK